jgi:hypothetical protein
MDRIYARGGAFLWLFVLLLFTACPPPVSRDVKDSDAVKGGPPVDDASFVGSDWRWDGTSLHLKFITENTALLWSDSGYYDPPILYDYRYDGGTKTGRVFNGRNSVGVKYDLGDFSISGNVLHFAHYGPYPHGADFLYQE